MTRLEIATKVLQCWAANPHMRGTNEEAAAVDRAAKVAESVPYIGGVKGDIAWREACDAIRALAPDAPKDAAPECACYRYCHDRDDLHQHADDPEHRDTRTNVGDVRGLHRERGARAMTAQWNEVRHEVRATKSAGSGWSVPMTACGLVVRSGSEISDDAPVTCGRCLEPQTRRARAA